MPKKIDPIDERFMKKVAQEFQERETCRKSYETHDVYHIEDWQEVHFIPGGLKLLRAHYIYDSRMGKALKKEFNPTIRLITEKNEIKKLKEIVQHPIRALKRGVFVRKLQPDPFSQLFDLILIMANHGKIAVPPTLSKIETPRQYRKRKMQYINIAFNLVISEK